MTDDRIVAVGPPITFRHLIASAIKADAESVPWLPTVTALEGSLEPGAAGPSVVVLSPGVKEVDAFGLAEFVARNAPATAVVLVRDRPMNGTLPAAMRAGIRDVVDLSKGGAELNEALERAVSWSDSIRSVGNGTSVERERRRGRVVSVFSSKGGTGKTFLACNVAVAVARDAGRDTAIVDLDLDLGDVFSYFGREPSRPLQDLMADEDEMTADQVRALGSDLAPNVWGYGSPTDPASRAVSGEAMGKVLQALRRSFDFVVIDASADYSDAALAAFDLSDEILLVAGLDVVGIRHLSLALQTLLSLGFPRERFRIVLNRADSKVGLQPEDVERVLGISVDARIPSSRLVPVSLNHGRPVVLEEPKSEVARALGALARTVAAVPDAAPARRRFRSSRASGGGS